MKVLPSKQISAFLSAFDPDPRLIYVVARILSHPPEHDQPESEKKTKQKWAFLFFTFLWSIFPY